MMCACEPDFTCARCRREYTAALRDPDPGERFEAMIGGLAWDETVAVPALADFEASE